MIRSSDSPLLPRMSSSFFCSGSGDMVRNRSATPSMPFMGVRISWLIIARNTALARLADSAAAAFSSARARAARSFFTMAALNWRMRSAT